jgi:hypothetical protein
VEVEAGSNNTVFSPAAEKRPNVSPPANFRTTCLTCHDDDLILQQRLTRSQWDRELNKMIGWGARVGPEEREVFLNYLENLRP